MTELKTLESRREESSILAPPAEINNMPNADLENHISPSQSILNTDNEEKRHPTRVSMPNAVDPNGYPNGDNVNGNHPDSDLDFDLDRASDQVIPSVEVLKLSKWLTFHDKKQYLQLHTFLISQTSKPIVMVMGGLLTIVFMIYVFELVAQGGATEIGTLMLTMRVLRIVSCGFAWLYLYYSMGNDPCVWKAIISADLFILGISIAGAIIFVIRCANGACDDDQNVDTCNPRHDVHGVPADSLVSNLFAIALLPIIFKAHKTSFLLVSYFVTFTGLMVGLIFANATDDILIIVVCIIGFGLMIYDHEKNMITMFLLIQNQQSYYDRLLAGERAKATAEIEKDELRNLIGSVAHDLKTPLHALMGELDGLQAEVNAIKQQLIGLTLLQSPAVTTHTNMITARSADAQNYIDSLRDIYQFMVMAINRAIEFRKTAAGLTLLASNETFHLSKAVEWAVDRFSNNPSGVPIRVEMSPVLHECCPFLITDKHWMTENILTLLSNACKFTSKGEIVLRMALITWECDPCLKELGLDEALSIDGKVATYRRVTAEWMADHPDQSVCVHIEVEDTGIGVSPESVHKLFRPFGNIQQGAGGTGLGLFSLAKRTEVLEGRCGMHKRGDGLSGCCFWFNFPYIPDAIAWQDSNSASDTNSHTDVMKAQLLKGNLSHDVTLALEDNVANTGQEDLSNKVVLVVDDSSLILKTTSRMLIKEGFEVETAQNGEEALKLMRSNLYLFVLSDIQMPVMDGLEMAQRLRQLEKDDTKSGKVSHRPQHIVGMSANSDAETRDDSLSSGMNSFIPKPVRIGELLKHLTHHIDNQV